MGGKRLNRAALWRKPEHFIEAIGRLRERRGALEMLKELRFADLPRIAALDEQLVTEQQRVGERALQFLAQESAFDTHRQALARLHAEVPHATTTGGLQAILDQLDETAAGLDLLTEQLAGLPGSDAVLRTAILDRISALYADINRLRAQTAGSFNVQLALEGLLIDWATGFRTAGGGFDAVDR